MVITSKDNEQIKYIRKLKDKKARDVRGEFFIEGMKLIREAIEENADIKTIVICDDCVKAGEISKKELYAIAKYNCIYASENVFHNIADVQTPQGILAVVGKGEPKEEIKYDEDIIVVLDDVQDPGNMGTILRTMDSIGLKQVVASKGCVDIYNPKVVRATMGAIFRVNVMESDDLKETIKDLKKRKIQIVATSPNTQDTIYDVKYKKTAIVVGNESNGISEEVMALADKKVKIPMLGRAESLNASVATGITLYEYVRQRLT
ncbi:MAG: RNA methyltransferase [Oscillospiraceae bacterium]|nr:RNA methyltransferase [Oscillospiraceae bacterium]